MKSEKLYIKMLQSISFRLFAVIAYILLFLTHRLSALRIDEIEMVDVTAVSYTHLDVYKRQDVVRHPLVQKIVKAYEKKTLERERVVQQRRNKR